MLEVIICSIISFHFKNIPGTSPHIGMFLFLFFSFFTFGRKRRQADLNERRVFAVFVHVFAADGGG